MLIVLQSAAVLGVFGLQGIENPRAALPELLINEGTHQTPSYNRSSTSHNTQRV